MEGADSETHAVKCIHLNSAFVNPGRYFFTLEGRGGEG